MRTSDALYMLSFKAKNKLPYHFNIVLDKITRYVCAVKTYPVFLSDQQYHNDLVLPYETLLISEFFLHD